MACPNQCADFEQVDILSASCQPELRYNAIKRIGFYKCNTVLPSPLTCNNLEPLVTAKDVVVSNLLANVAIGEPVIAERVVSDCLPPQEYVESREVTGEDRIAVDVDTLGEASPFYDWAFWKDKQDHRTQLNVFFVMCDGSVIVPREKNSLQGMSATFNVFLNFEKLNNGQGAIEFKAFKFKFKGDPFQFVAPELNLANCPTLAQLS